MNITIVPHGELHAVLPHIVEYVKKAREWTLGRWNTDDLLALAFNKNVATWVLFDDDNAIHGYLMTEIVDYPQARHFCVLNCGGRDGSLDACVELVFDTFEQYAKDSGCDGVEIMGRPAWWKHIKARGYDAPQRQYFKPFDKGE